MDGLDLEGLFQLKRVYESIFVFLGKMLDLCKSKILP